ncbi:sensor domain-containing diguanylate cyclase [Thermus neutrinimicus]|uniref:sensor domain-containing diguanylate cyclase n=1 Tax=Thermus neutrinimicus TaxID=2908149 RepID=UPI001FA9A836|nr:sensor domain-containing diguanylate cyclase [Thermus neutrinimicus]
MPLPYPVIALGSLLLGLLAGVLGYPDPYILPWFMILTASTASVYGLPLGLLAALLSTGLLLLFPGFHPMALAILLLSAWLAHAIGESLRKAHRRAKALAKSQRYLAEALEALPQAENRHALLQSLPERLAALGTGGHVGVWVPTGQGFRLLASVPPLELEEVPATGVLGRALREGQPVHVPDVRKEPGYIAAPHLKVLSELALPLWERGEVVAVLNLERPHPFAPEEVEGLVRFAQAVSLELDRLADLEERRLLAGLSERLHSARTLEEAGEKALHLLLQTLGLEAGTLWQAQGGRMKALAHHGVNEPSLLQVLEEGLPYGQGLAWKVYQTSSPLFTARYTEEPGAIPPLKALGWDTLAALPILTPGAPRSRWVLVVGERAKRLWRKAEIELLLMACRTLGLGLERLQEKARHEAVNRLFLEFLEKPPEELYPRVLEEAIRQVPGSETGSLLVWEDGAYRYKAAMGYDLEGLRAVAFLQEDQLLWYGLGPHKARQGEPRILSQEEKPIAEISHQTAPPEVIDTAGKALEIKANLCLPIPYKGEVLAYLNLDSLHDPKAFGQDSLEVARFFAAPLATLLHEVRARKLLEEAALTDPLTGLGNRRAFERFLQEELKRAERYGHPLSLAVLDLRGFKAVNDRLGHAVGDLALIRVAEVMERERRNGDRLFRWGGDEFAAIFPHTPKRGAVAAALRYAKAIQGLCFDGLCLGVNIGVASYPEDGTTQDELLSAADTRMYEAKARGQVMVG